MNKTYYKQTEIGEIPEDWDVDKIGDVADVTKLAGYEFTKYVKYSNDGEIIALRALNLSNGILDLSNVQRIDRKVSDQLIRSKLFSGDILLSYTGTIGNFAIVKENDRYHLAPNVCRIRTGKRCLPEFMYHVMRTRAFQSSLVNRSHGSTQSTIPMKNIREIYIPLPPIEQQKQLIIFLTSLDDKIELNRKMNATLEEIGKALFKRWFVDFEFPNDDGEPYISSGGKMVDSELGKIPEGWEVKKLSDFGKIVCGKTPPKSETSFFDGVIPFIKIPDMHGNTFVVKTEDALSEEGRDYQKNKTLPKYSLCVSCIATVGLVSITSQESQTNQQINSIIPSELKFLPYLYFQLKSMVQKLIDYASGGSATPNLNTGDFANLSIIFPKNETLNSFFTNVWSLLEQILNNDLENSKLENMRDSLLPRLMSGKLRV